MDRLFWYHYGYELASIIATLQVCRKNRAEKFDILMLVDGETAGKLLEVARDAEHDVKVARDRIGKKLKPGRKKSRTRLSCRGESTFFLRNPR